MMMSQRNMDGDRRADGIITLTSGLMGLPV
jgi:hypothetical protein